MVHKTSLSLLTLMVLLTCIHAQDWGFDGCAAATTCSECIIRSPRCGWCSQKNFGDKGFSRCDTITRLTRNNCSDTFITYPSNILTSKTSEKLGSSGSGKFVQVQPQSLHLKLRPNVPYTFGVKVQQDKEYPVDLYYLMDLSFSMKDDKDKLAELGDLLAEGMSNLTSNFRLGYGSFVDKVLMPYTSTVPQKLKEPCLECAAPYGFKNHMSLSLNTSQFSKEVKEAQVSGNLDAPEGGFDAIMQAMVCPDIGWRPQSRKLLVLSTDSGFHTAGDGKIGGVVKPNDGLCHMDKNNFYSASKNQDYPSVGQIDMKATDKKVNVIFAVTEGQLPTYNQLEKQVEGSSSRMLSSDSSNVVDLIKDQYSKITSVIEMRHTAPKFVEVNFFSKCSGEFKKATNKCKGLKLGDKVEFEVEIKVLYCPNNMNDWSTMFKIYPVGLDELQVKLEVLCQCECERAEQEERFSPYCSSGNGTYLCGVCECYPGRYGHRCECNRNNLEDKTEDSCRISINDKICSGNGDCTCGKCICNSPHITGKLCECDNVGCDIENGKMCSGEENGECTCGICICKNNRTGPTCQCGPDSLCVDPKTNLVCNNQGKCECGVCQCFGTPDGSYEGNYCQNYPEIEKSCKDFEECVLCYVHDLGPLKKQNFCQNCTDEIHIDVYDEVDQEDDEYLCHFESELDDDEGCQVRYVYKMNATKAMVRAEKERRCPGAIDMDAIIWGIIAALLVLLIGLLLLLIWKLWTRYQDNRDYAKFEREKESAKWDAGGNPLFKAATTTFKNPTYGAKNSQLKM